jgi:aspartyl-tRNA(Asn)/glutamyl-tRNA(Gln) amidotransferase subunit A
MTTDLTDMTVGQAAGLIAARELSPVDLTRACLARIEQVEPDLTSFITVTAEPALAQAHAAEAAIGRGAYRGPLHGIPIALKDLFETNGVRTTAGSSFLATNVPDADAAVVHLLNVAGAVSLGKLNMHEWAFGTASNNPHYGACKNPWNLDHSPGGSSGGSGAALAARLCLAALGSDTGGSIRIPAALCGVVGLKPTAGRISTRGVLPLSWSLDHVGPMARCVRDVALLTQALAGYDPADPGSVDRPADDYLGNLADGVRGWRVALASGPFFAVADGEVRAATRAAAGVFAELGARVTETALPVLDEAGAMNGLLLGAEATAYHHERLRENPAGFGADVREKLQRGLAHTATEYALARRAGSLLRRQFDLFFDDYDVLLLPATPTAAPRRDEPAAEAAARPSLTRFTAPFNLTGLPALSVPCGFTTSGLPIGLQIVARPWAEATALRAGHAYEQATDWHRRQPDLRGAGE